MALADGLRAAKALIDTPEKWAKGAYLTESGCMCALGAARKAYFGVVFSPSEDHGYSGDVNPVATALNRQLLPKWGNSLDEFNDDPLTTHADVMALLDRAIAAAEPAPSLEIDE